jgi:hypothetical protein
MFTKAVRSQRKARIALIGVAGSGKTYTALQLAAGLADGGKIAVLDTENASAALYSDTVPFDVCVLGHHAPSEYVKAIDAAAKSGYAVLVIDSLSHAWAGRGGALEMVDKAAARDPNRNSYAAWRNVTPEQNRLVDAITSAPLHVIVTMRSKMEYVIEKDDRGRTSIVKKGLQPVQRDGLDYEFDIVGDMESARLTISKCRMQALSDEAVFDRPTSELGQRVLEWLRSGEAPKPAQKQAKDEPKPKTKAEPKQTTVLELINDRAGLLAAVYADQGQPKAVAACVDELGVKAREICGAPKPAPIKAEHVIAAYDAIVESILMPEEE